MLQSVKLRQEAENRVLTKDGRRTIMCLVKSPSIRPSGPTAVLKGPGDPGPFLFGGRA